MSEHEHAPAENVPAEDFPQDEHEQPGLPRRRLGRGLNALLGSPGMPDSENGTPALPDQSEIAVELIEPNPFQPRKQFEADPLNDLVNSIRQHGVLQPLLVRAIGDQYQLIAGERRLIAAKRAGLEAVPCRVLDLDDRRVFEVAIEENLKRQDLNVLEKAQGFQDYLNRFGGTIDELARSLSLDRSTVSNMIRLLELPDTVQDALRSGALSAGHARTLLPLERSDQIALAERIEAESLSVRRTERAVRELLQQRNEGGTVPFEQPSSQATLQPEVTNHLLSLQDQLRDLLGAHVEIKLKGKDKGRIVIQFESNSQFEHILRQLRRAA